MKVEFSIIIVLSLFSCSFIGKPESLKLEPNKKEVIDELFSKLDLENQLELRVFEYAVIGYEQLKANRKKDVLTIIDYSKSSTEKRMFIIDMEEGKLLQHTFVAHGKNSGEDCARSFSNTCGSKQTSLGFYLTMNTYEGGHGYSLKLKGLEVGINDNAYKRAIVLHGADYVSEDFIKIHGRLGRSWGCPAVKKELSREIIDNIKNGSIIFAYSDEGYVEESNVISHYLQEI